MNTIKATLILCITLFLCVSLLILFKFYEERYVFVAQDKGVFVFDRRNISGSQCVDGVCRKLDLNFMAPTIELYPEGFDGPGIIVPQGAAVPYNGPSPADQKSGGSYYLVPGIPRGGNNAINQGMERFAQQSQLPQTEEEQVSENYARNQNYVSQYPSNNSYGNVNNGGGYSSGSSYGSAAQNSGYGASRY